MEKLKSAFEFVAPSTPTGFLIYGWLGSMVAGWGLAAVTSLTGFWPFGFVVVLLIWAPLWIRAKNKREESLRLQAFVNELHQAMVESERVKKETGNVGPTPAD